MKRAFELLLVLILFYGVYSAFDVGLPYVFPYISDFWIVIVSLLAAFALLVLYSMIIYGNTKKSLAQKMKQTVSDLEEKVHIKEQELKEKDTELHNAFKIKKAIEDEAEETLI